MNNSNDSLIKTRTGINMYHTERVTEDSSPLMYSDGLSKTNTEVDWTGLLSLIFIFYNDERFNH